MRYDNIQQFVNIYDRDNVVFCYGNYAVVDMIKNQILSADKVGLNIVVFALDEKIAEEMSAICDVVRYFDDAVDEDVFYECGTKEFWDIAWAGWFIGEKILSSGKSFICLDADVVVRKNFEDDLLSQYKGTNYDCLVQSNGSSACTGFYSLRPTHRARSVYTKAFLEENKYWEDTHDQSFFNRVFKRRNVLHIKHLDRDEYPAGQYYYENFERIDDVCKIVHFNGVKGYETKIAKMKKHSLWALQ